MMDEIADCAGKVWRHLEEHRDSTLEEMTKALKLKESVAWMALGWLAREDISLLLTLRDQAVSIRNIPLSVADQLRDTVQSPQQALDPGSTTPRSESRSPKASRSIYSGSTDELDLIAALRSGDELAFTQLVGTYQNRLLRTARTYVSSEAEAEEVVQETWLGVLKGLESFEGRCSLKTWIFQILINRARTRGKREARMIPFSVMFDAQTDPGAPAVDPSLFNDNGPESIGGWISPPRDWGKSPEQALLSQEFRALVQAAIDALPPSQKQVITLHDVQGWTSREVCDILGTSEANQRVLLHRARCKVRQALDQYYAYEVGWNGSQSQRHVLQGAGRIGDRLSRRRSFARRSAAL